MSYSTGSSVVISLSSMLLSSLSAEYSVVVLPEPVGPVTSTMPFGFSIASRNLAERRRVHADRVQVERRHRPIEHPHNHALAEHRRQHAHAQIDRVAADRQLDAPVLRQPALGDIEVRHHLDAGRNRKRQMPRRRHHFVQHAVGLDANLELVFERLEVQVAGVLANRHQQHHVQQLANRCAIGQGRHVVEIDRPIGANAGRRRGQIGIVLQRGDDALHAVGALAVVPLQRRSHRRLGRHHHANVEAQKRPQLVLHAQVLRIAHGDGERIAIELDRDDSIHLRHRRRDHRQALLS